MGDGSEFYRRNFLKSGATTVLSLTGLTAASEADEGPHEYDSRNILYGPHREGSDPYDFSELSDEVDGIFLENSTDYLQKPLDQLENLRSRPQYRELIDEMAENDVSLYFGDVDLSSEARKIETGLMAAEAGAGAALATHTARGKDFSKTDGTLAGISGWMLQPFTTYTAFMGSEGEVDYVEASNDMHPESFAMTRGLRNSITAYKQNNLDGEFGTVWGSLHVGFEECLEQSNASLRQDIKRYEDVWKEFVGNEDTVFRAVEMQSDNGNWNVEEIHEFPELENTV